MLKSVQGTFNQGDTKFGASAGRQCACCSLFAILFSKIKSPGCWTSNDLDYIVQEGDELFKSIGKYDTFLSVPDLPSQLTVFENHVDVV